MIKSQLYNIEKLAPQTDEFQQYKRTCFVGKSFHFIFQPPVAARRWQPRGRAYKEAVKKIDQAATRGIIHKNAAAHKKSQFTIKLNKMA